MNNELILGDCHKVLRGWIAGNGSGPRFTAIVTDPPAGIAFMGKEWDKAHGGRDAWIADMAEIANLCLQLCLPGAHALVWALPRTSHWTATAWENGGWEVRDRIAHAFGSGFPKSLDVSKALDKAAGAEREVVRERSYELRNDGGYSGGLNTTKPRSESCELSTPSTALAREWEGYGTALKPAIEDWWLLRKPLIGTVAENVTQYGCGALNIDGTRISGESVPINKLESWSGFGQVIRPEYTQEINTAGRFPANLIHDGSDEVVGMFPVTTSGKPTKGTHRISATYSEGGGKWNTVGRSLVGGGDTGSAARFFYCAKASRAEREMGCEGMPRAYNDFQRESSGLSQGKNPITGERSGKRCESSSNHHPTVKPLALMRYLLTLVRQPSVNLVLDPFMGSGSTGVAAAQLGIPFVGIEQDAEYYEIAKRRIAAAGLPLLEAEE